MAETTMKSWFGRDINYFEEPWYRFSRVFALLDRHVAIPPGSPWLDVGCQIGQFLKLLQVRFGIVPIGIDDFNEGNVVEVCRRHLGLEIKLPREVINGSWRYLSRRIHETGFDLDEKVPFISALEIIEHMVDTDAFLRECRDHLTDDGYLIMSTPNINSLRNRVQVPLGAYPAGMEYRTVNHHVRLYNIDALKSHGEAHGFRLVGITGVSFLPQRFLRYEVVRKIDPWLCDRFPSLCSAIVALFKAEPCLRS